MYREFNFTAIDTDTKTKTITVTMTAAVDESTLIEDNIKLLDCSTNHYIDISVKSDGDKLFIILPDYPIPNSKYHLTIKGIKNIVGDALTKGINYQIEFESSVNTEVRFIAPVFSEDIQGELIFALQEFISKKDISNLEDVKFVNSFFIEVSTDNLFNKIVFSTNLIHRNSMSVMELGNGQYYARARVQIDEENYGIWSDIITFVINRSEDNTSITNLNNKSNDDSDEPIFYKPLTITGVPKDGDDCQSFYVEFSSDIDLEDTDDIEVYRRLI